MKIMAVACWANKTCVINDPVGLINSPTSCDHYFSALVVLFGDILKSGDGRTDGNVQK